MSSSSRRSAQRLDFRFAASGVEVLFSDVDLGLMDQPAVNPGFLVGSKVGIAGMVI